MIIDSSDEWGHFLHARALLIRRFMREGKSPEEIARLLTMDGDQVLLIAMTPIQLEGLAPERGQ